MIQLIWVFRVFSWRILLLILLTGEASKDSSEYNKCRLWLRAGIKSNISKLSIECHDIDLTSLGDLKYLTTFLETVPMPCLCLSLSLVNFKYPEGLLVDSWFCSPGILNLNIKSLRIEGGLSNIAMDGLRCLPVLDTLIMSKTNIRHLWRKPFHNVATLRRLELHSNNLLRTADTDFLYPLSRLNALHITNLDTDMQGFLQNMTTDGLELETVEWSNSNLGLVPSLVLLRLPNLKYMDLRSSRIRTIGYGFNELENLKILMLDNNHIRVVPETNRKLIERLSGLFMQNNPLVCNCGMVWLQRYIIQKRNGTYGDFKEVLCAEPEELRDIPFLKAEMCEPPRETPTPPTECPMIEIRCQSARDNTTRSFTIADEGKSIVLGETIKLDGEKQNFTVIQDEKFDRMIINIRNVMGKSKTLVYWDTLKTSQPMYRCVTDITDGFTATIQYNTNYIICVFDKLDRISLSDCKPFRTEKSYSDRAWLTNNMKPVVTIFVVALILTMLLSGGALAYFILLYNPTLLRGSKRVITVITRDKKESSVIIMPKNFDKRTPPQSRDPDHNNDDASSTASYISAVPTAPSEPAEPRLQVLKKYALPYPLPRPS